MRWLRSAASRELADFLRGHERVVEVGECEIVTLGRDFLRAIEQRVDQAFRRDRAAGVVDDDRFGHEPRNRSAVLEE